MIGTDTSRHYLPIPSSDHADCADRADRQNSIPLSAPIANESLDDTQTFRRRRATDLDDGGTFRASGSGVNFPTAILLYLVAQLIGGIWWAATQQARVEYLTQENTKLWQKVETHDLQLGRLDSVVRSAVKEAMEDADYIRLRKRENNKGD